MHEAHYSCGISLLDELDDDLMLDLDEVVRQNQLECLPISKSSRAEAELVEKYPELPRMIESGRQATIDSIILQTRLREEDTRYGSFSRGKAANVDHSNSSPLAQSSRPRSSKGRSGAIKSPYLKAKSSTADLMFEMDEGADPGTNLFNVTTPTGETHQDRVGLDQALCLRPSTDPFMLDSEERLLTLETEMNPANSVSPWPSSDPIQLGTHENTADQSEEPPPRSIKPWGPTFLSSHKLDMRDIMAQASSNRISTLSSGLSHQAQNVASKASNLPKISQRTRKKQQQQQQKQPENLSSLEVNIPPDLNNANTSDEKPKSPWQIPSTGPKFSLKDVLGTVQNDSPTPKQGAPRTNSPLTLRQTVPGNIANLQRFVTEGEGQNLSSSNRAVSSPSITQPQEAQPHALRSVSATQPPTTPSSSSNPIPHSIRHYFPTVEPSLQLSMADIVSQQQTEKDIIRDVGAKRSLQEIQEEQAFQEWWDEESRKVRMEEEARGIDSRNEGGRGGMGRGRGRGRGRGSERGGLRGKGKERDGSKRRGGEKVRRGRGGSRGGGMVGSGEENGEGRAKLETRQV